MVTGAAYGQQGMFCPPISSYHDDRDLVLCIITIPSYYYLSFSYPSDFNENYHCLENFGHVKILLPRKLSWDLKIELLVEYATKLVVMPKRTRSVRCLVDPYILNGRSEVVHKITHHCLKWIVSTSCDPR